MVRMIMRDLHLLLAVRVHHEKLVHTLDARLEDQALAIRRGKRLARIHMRQLIRKPTGTLRRSDGDHTQQNQSSHAVESNSRPTHQSSQWDEPALSRLPHPELHDRLAQVSALVRGILIPLAVALVFAAARRWVPVSALDTGSVSRLTTFNDQSGSSILA